MEEAFRPGGFLDKPPAKSPHPLTKDPSLPPLKREDVDLIVRPVVYPKEYSKKSDGFLSQVHEFEITRLQAEKVLSENGGDLKKALTSFITADPHVDLRSKPLV